MAELNTAEEVKQFFTDHPHIGELHFDAEGNHHINVYENAEGEKVTHIDPLGKSKTVIAESITREQALEDAQLVEKVLEALAAKDVVVEEEIVMSEEVKDVKEDENHDDLIPEDGAMTE